MYKSISFHFLLIIVFYTGRFIQIYTGRFMEFYTACISCFFVFAVGLLYFVVFVRRCCGFALCFAVVCVPKRVCGN